ncbi:hypothetical protein [Mangrovibacillus cuniculi]|uniref:Lipoprotein n=1 Tax=Mangrovibacillus cuniculi TaxID=2593652 RepID=A0A7S8CAN6_9BACI|nr:hypothetical protein [Mangrovibacillus cuniculi]QPC46502.1 hypothetical protein G8O30_05740 [Mangrovibacillus cuniculi]
MNRLIKTNTYWVVLLLCSIITMGCTHETTLVRVGVGDEESTFITIYDENKLVQYEYYFKQADWKTKSINMNSKEDYVLALTFKKGDIAEEEVYKLWLKGEESVEMLNHSTGEMGILIGENAAIMKKMILSEVRN